jgi:hypothetical protein
MIRRWAVVLDYKTNVVVCYEGYSNKVNAPKWIEIA